MSGGIRYSDVETYVRAGLGGLGYSNPANPNVGEVVKPLPLFDPGPFTIERIRKRSPSAMLFLVLGNGLGPTTENAYDRPFITVRAVGMQGGFGYAEKLAYDVDDLLLAVANGVNMGTARTLYVTRTGGAPQLVDFDAGERYHYQTTYITEAKR